MNYFSKMITTKDLSNKHGLDNVITYHWLMRDWRSIYGTTFKPCHNFVSQWRNQLWQICLIYLLGDIYTYHYIQSKNQHLQYLPSLDQKLDQALVFSAHHNLWGLWRLFCLVGVSTENGKNSTLRNFVEYLQNW